MATEGGNEAGNAIVFTNGQHMTGGVGAFGLLWAPVLQKSAICGLWSGFVFAVDAQSLAGGFDVAHLGRRNIRSGFNRDSGDQGGEQNEIRLIDLTLASV